MKTLITMVMLAMFGFVIVGCEASGSVGSDDNGTKHEVEQKRTVTDANGNVIQSTDTKTEQHTNP
jgi:hypothetical protein